MAKRFSLRDMGLLTAPVLAIGAVGLMSLQHPKPPLAEGKPRLTFHIEKPTMLEAFDGSQVAFVLGLKQPKKLFRVIGSYGYLELQTARGPIFLPQGRERQGWGDVWHNNITGSRLPVDLSRIPPGDLSFGSRGAIIDYNSLGHDSGTSSFLPEPMKGKWKINRAQIKAPTLAAMPRKPLISLREVKISRVDSDPQFVGRLVSGEAIFRDDGSKTSGNTALEIRVFSANGNIVHANNINWSRTPDKPRQHIAEWTVDYLKTSNPKVRIVGRVSADNRWPLGFQIEPFNFKTIKVGQKLKFKQFPVPLPKP